VALRGMKDTCYLTTKFLIYTVHLIFYGPSDVKKIVLVSFAWQEHNARRRQAQNRQIRRTDTSHESSYSADRCILK
jgi:hypothetical protein